MNTQEHRNKCLSAINHWFRTEFKKLLEDSNILDNVEMVEVKNFKESPGLPTLSTYGGIIEVPNDILSKIGEKPHLIPTLCPLLQTSLNVSFDTLKLVIEKHRTTPGDKVLLGYLHGAIYPELLIQNLPDVMPLSMDPRPYAYLPNRIKIRQIIGACPG
jgi:hypothetical protein